MDKLIPLFILIGLVLIGFISAIFSLNDIRKRHGFTFDYRDNFIKYIDELFNQKRVNQELYYDLTLKVKEMQCELGVDGLCTAQDNLNGYVARNHQLLINFLPKSLNYVNDSWNSLHCQRYQQEANACDAMFVRHLGTLEKMEETALKNIFNPFVSFARGVRFVLHLPVHLLEWFGIISNEKTKKIHKNIILRFFEIVVTIVSFVSEVIAIVVGWNDFWQFISNVFSGVIHFLGL